MKGYEQLTETQRHQIGALKKAGQRQNAIAATIGVSAPTLSRGLKRNTGKRGCRAKQANIKASDRRQQAAKAIKTAPEAVALTEGHIRLDWSPEQVSGWSGAERGIAIGHGRIYRHVWADKSQGGGLYKHLRHSHKKRKKQYGPKDKRGQVPNRVSIDERPAIVAEKGRLGDWGIDTVIGKNHQGALVTIVDRASKSALIKKVGSQHAEGVTEATIALLKPYLDRALTITADNGKEFAGHETITGQLKADVYFAHPYRSWERGLDENTNGLTRQHFTKGSSFENISDKDVAKVMERPDHRPRKTLNYKTPHSVFFAKPLQEAA